MAPFRIPFTSRRPVNGTADITTDENANPNSTSPYKPSLALGTKERRDEPNEFKMSSVNDSGEYLPPSPTEKQTPTPWLKSPTSATSSNYRSGLSEAEPFSISRESFDSYRRSFDISGRSPILHADSFTSRTSLDSRRSGFMPRSSVSNDTFSRPLPQQLEREHEQDFEDVKLQDDTLHKPKKKSFLSRFGESADDRDNSNSDGSGKHHFSLLTGRRRGQSGTGSELENVQRRRGQSGTGSELENPQRPSSKGKPDATIVR